ncbi:MAG: SsrA-binding protein SmpB [Bacteroidia bacterium]
MAKSKFDIDEEVLHNIITNRKARFEYHLEEGFIAGIVLTGTEVKSLRAGKANFLDTYCMLENDEMFIRNLHINEYTLGTYNNHIPNRVRKLLLQKKEIRKIRKKLEEKGFTLVPLQLFFNQKNLVKVHLALAKGKKLYDKREDVKERDAKREIARKGKWD